MLAVVVEGVLGSFHNGDVPVHMPREGADVIPSMGYPVPVRSRCHRSVTFRCAVCR
jgi:hypothetical protein